MRIELEFKNGNRKTLFGVEKIINYYSIYGYDEFYFDSSRNGLTIKIKPPKGKSLIFDFGVGRYPDIVLKNDLSNIKMYSEASY